jgi:hypothetical protein
MFVSGTVSYTARASASIPRLTRRMSRFYFAAIMSQAANQMPRPAGWLTNPATLAIR